MNKIKLLLWLFVACYAALSIRELLHAYWFDAVVCFMVAAAIGALLMKAEAEK